MKNINFDSLRKNAVNENRIKKYLKYLDILSDSLNQIHSVNFSKGYWEMLIGPWLLFFICISDTRYIVDKRNIFKNKILPEKNKILRCPYNMNSYILLTNSNDYFETLDEYVFTNKITHDLILYNSNSHTKNYIKNTLRKINNKISKLILRYLSIALIDTYLPLSQRIKIFIYSKFKFFPIGLKNYKIENKNINLNIRKKIIPNNFISSDNLDLLLSKIIPFQIPFIYLEGYKELENQLPLINDKLKVIFTSIGLFENDLLKLLCAKSKFLYKTKIIASQHGGFPYGMTDCPMPYQEKKLADKFLTWGWAQDENDVEFISLRISHNKKVLKKSRIFKNYDKILYISTCGSNFLPSDFGMIDGVGWEKYYSDQKKFFEALDGKISKKIEVRLHPADWMYGSVQRKNFLSISKTIDFDIKKKFIDSLSDKKLVIIDHLQTTFLETIAFDIPTIIFLDENEWIINNDFSLTYNKLKNANIIHTSPESATRFLNNNYVNIDNWWSSNEVRKATEDIKKYFIKMSLKPEKKLIDYLEKIKN